MLLYFIFNYIFKDQKHFVPAIGLKAVLATLVSDAREQGCDKTRDCFRNCNCHPVRVNANE